MLLISILQDSAPVIGFNLCGGFTGRLLEVEDAPHISNFLYVAQIPQEWVHDQDPPRASPQFSDLPCCPALHRHTHTVSTHWEGATTPLVRLETPVRHHQRLASHPNPDPSNDNGCWPARDTSAEGPVLRGVLGVTGALGPPAMPPTRARVRVAVAANALPHRDSVAATRDLTDEILQQCTKARNPTSQTYLRARSSSIGHLGAVSSTVRW